jgi:pyrroloquinoline quinone biosynthesis protein D
MIDANAHPRLAAKARLRQDRHGGQTLLLYPEAGLALNGTAAAVLGLCTGEHSVEAIVDRLCATYAAASRARIEAEVTDLLRGLVARGLVVAGA